MVGVVAFIIHHRRRRHPAGRVFTVGPTRVRVMQLFGDYKGTAAAPGLRWANPFYTKKLFLAAREEFRGPPSSR
jgi:hypothetical protein